jgi:hypothetical protein
MTRALNRNLHCDYLPQVNASCSHLFIVLKTFCISCRRQGKFIWWYSVWIVGLCAYDRGEIKHKFNGYPSMTTKPFAVLRQQLLRPNSEACSLNSNRRGYPDNLLIPQTLTMRWRQQVPLMEPTYHATLFHFLEDRLLSYLLPWESQNSQKSNVPYSLSVLKLKIWYKTNALLETRPQRNWLAKLVSRTSHVELNKTVHLTGLLSSVGKLNTKSEDRKILLKHSNNKNHAVRYSIR